MACWFREHRCDTKYLMKRLFWTISVLKNLSLNHRAPPWQTHPMQSDTQSPQLCAWIKFLFSSHFKMSMKFQHMNPLGTHNHSKVQELCQVITGDTGGEITPCLSEREKKDHAEIRQSVLLNLESSTHRRHYFRRTSISEVFPKLT